MAATANGQGAPVMRPSPAGCVQDKAEAKPAADSRPASSQSASPSHAPLPPWQGARGQGFGQQGKGKPPRYSDPPAHVFLTQHHLFRDKVFSEADWSHYMSYARFLPEPKVLCAPSSHTLISRHICGTAVNCHIRGTADIICTVASQLTLA
jgi:hypothetical protein